MDRRKFLQSTAALASVTMAGKTMVAHAQGAMVMPIGKLLWPSIKSQMNS